MIEIAARRLGHSENKWLPSLETRNQTRNLIEKITRQVESQAGFATEVGEQLRGYLRTDPAEQEVRFLAKLTQGAQDVVDANRGLKLGRVALVLANMGMSINSVDVRMSQDTRTRATGIIQTTIEILLGENAHFGPNAGALGRVIIDLISGLEKHGGFAPELVSLLSNALPKFAAAPGAR